MYSIFKSWTPYIILYGYDGKSYLQATHTHSLACMTTNDDIIFKERGEEENFNNVFVMPLIVIFFVTWVNDFSMCLLCLCRYQNAWGRLGARLNVLHNFRFICSSSPFLNGNFVFSRVFFPLFQNLFDMFFSRGRWKTLWKFSLCQNRKGISNDFLLIQIKSWNIWSFKLDWFNQWEVESFSWGCFSSLTSSKGGRSKRWNVKAF